VTAVEPCSEGYMVDPIKLQRERLKPHNSARKKQCLKKGEGTISLKKAKTEGDN